MQKLEALNKIPAQFTQKKPTGYLTTFTFRQLTCSWIGGQYRLLQAVDPLSRPAGTGLPPSGARRQHADAGCVCRRLHPDRRGCRHDAGGLPRMLWSHSGVSVPAGDSQWPFIYMSLNISKGYFKLQVMV